MTSSLNFTEMELAAAVSRGVRQCVLIGSQAPVQEAFDGSLQLFAIDEQPPAASPATFIPTQFASEPLATALTKSDFDKLKASLFVWLGGARYSTIQAVLASLAYIASLPKGSGVVFDYAAECISLSSVTHTALDALTSRVCLAGGRIKHRIQPQAVSAMLRSLGFQNIVDLAQEELSTCGGHLVSAAV